MIQFRTLGTLGLTSDDGREIQSLLAQPKRVALLAYLALARPHGFHRRDALLALFWADWDEARARNALRQALHYLRRSLGPDVVVSRGEDELGVDPERLRCDARELQRLLASGDREEALELYEGELLGGFYVDDAGGFEAWLDAERRHIRRAAATAARELSEEHEHEGELDQAIRRAREQVEISANDEDALRRLMVLLERSGNRIAALREYESFTKRWRAEHGSDPSEETTGLFAAIRARESAAPAAVAAPAEAGEPDATETEASGDGPAPPGRWPPRIGWAAAALVVILGILGARASRNAPAVPDTAEADAAGPENVVAVLPFTVRGTGELDFLREGMVDLMSTALDGAGDLRSLDARVVLRAASAADAGRETTPAVGRPLSEELAAGLFVVGSVLEVQEALRIDAALYETDSGRQVTAAHVDGQIDEVSLMVDDLAGQLLGDLQRGRLARSASRTTDSLEALKAYLRGEEELRRDRPAEAISSFERAVEIDSTFALANYRLSIRAEWEGRTDVAHRALAQAERHAGRLSSRDSALVAALGSFLRGDGDLAERRYRALVDNYPDDVEALYMLAETHRHYGPLTGRPIVEALPMLREVIRLDPEFRPGARSHLAELSLWTRDRSGVRSWAGQILELARDAGPAPGASGTGTVCPECGYFELMRDYTPGEETSHALLRDRLERGAVRPQSVIVPLSLGDVIGIELFLDTGPGSGPDHVQFEKLILAYTELARGRWSRTSERLDDLSAVGGTNVAMSAIFRAFAAVSPFLDLPRDELESIRAGIARLDPQLSSRETENSSVVRNSAQTIEYLQGMLSARLGDSVRALDHAERVLAAPRRPFEGTLATDRAAGIRAVLARAEGRPADALAELEAAPLRVPLAAFTRDFSGALAHERYLMAELLYEEGRIDEAVAWYTTAPESPTWVNWAFSAIYLAPANLRLGQIYESRGDRERAAARYSRVIELWADCDPELRPALQTAREGLARVSD